jgi:hypothetical protein
VIKKHLKRRSNNSGAVFVELTLSLTFLGVVILGFAQYYVRSIDRLDHYSLATQVVMGPQYPSIVYNSTTGVFSSLGAATSPTQATYLQEIINFLEAHAPSNKYSFINALGYLNINPNTGVLGAAPGYQAINTTDMKEGYLSLAAGPCAAQTRLKEVLKIFAETKLGEIYSAMNGTPSSATDDSKRMGLKLYDFYLDNTRNLQYAEVYPYIFLLVCSNNTNVLYSQQTITLHMISPRRLVN